MNIADELQKLADLRKNGHLTDQEFADAKRRLIADGQNPHIASQKYQSPNEVSDAVSKIAQKTYWSSRWSSGNLFFRDSLVLASDGIIFRKGRLFGSSEENINYKAVASFRIRNGIFLSNILIETSGGSDPIVVNGLWKSEAKEIQATIKAFQREV